MTSGSCPLVTGPARKGRCRAVRWAGWWPARYGMAEAVRRLLAVPEVQRRAAARAAAERYPWAETVARLLDGY